ncbi:porin [Arcobacter arenosus]|uniref:Porin n=1 Tax=Arcobacter arenosus TaxID=2576037 RepID=A0A5R8Y6N2_9BACT|nr:major outer membrane protein [Arcobacter arenosus]TLP41243.1 porin [Arcobacter arenosus]
MKKFAKMSLVAAVAVAGMTSYASAGSLEEAIKDSTISGYARYRMNTDHENDMDTRGEVKLVVKVTTKVNDNVTASVKTVTDNAASSATSDSAAKDFSWNQMFFTYANGPLTVSAGRLGLVSPMTDNGNSGNGIVATYGLGAVTLAGAYYLDTDKVEGRLPLTNYQGVSVYGLGVLGSVEMVNFEAWYLSTLDEVSDVATTYDAVSGYTLAADATFGPIGVNARYAELDADGALAGADISYLQAGINGSIGIVSAQLNYVKTGEDSGDTTFDGDVDAANNLGLLTNDMMLINDADAWHLGLSAKVTDTITLGAHYLSVDGNSNSNIVDATETELNAKYQMSKNFYVLGRLSMGEVDDGIAGNNDDFQNSRIELKYSF